MAMQPAPMAAVEPDPYAPMPEGDWLRLQPAASNAPLAPGRRLSQASLSPSSLGGRKPLRPVKGRAPRAKSIDTNALLNRDDVPRAERIAPAAPAAPADQPAGPPSRPSTAASFDGGADDDTSIPPDTQAAFSTTHVFNPLNNNVHVFDLSGTLVTQLSLNAFWASIAPNGHTFDPKAVFDPAEKRFYFVSMANAEAPTSSLLIAISDGEDPSGNWRFQPVMVDAQAQGQVWMDYPSLGFTSDKITVQVNLFTIGSNNFAGSTVYVFDKASLLEPNQAVSMTRFMLPNQGATQAPAITYDAGQADQYLVSSWTGNSNGKGFLAVWRITGNPAANSTAVARVGFVSGSLTWDSFPPNGEFAPQSGTADKLDVGDDRMLSVVLRDGTLYCCHTVMLPAGGATRSSVQWWIVPTGTWTATTGLLDDEEGGNFFAFPSLSTNQRGDICIGHAQFSASSFASGGWLVVPAGGGTQTADLFAPGQNTYLKRFGGPANRWGDYSATQVDPKTDQDFWTIQEHAGPQQDTWQTRIARISVPPAGTV